MKENTKSKFSDFHPIWDSQSLKEALEVDIPASFNIFSVSIDSRNLTPNSLFIALKGEHFNGNDFVQDAIQNGAVLCIVDEKIGIPDNLRKHIIQTENSLEALYKLARYSRNRMQGKIIGITGSVGKTSTKEMLKMALSQQGNVFASYGNYNNHYGLPLNMANMPQNTDYGIFEMGMSAPGEIKELSKLAKPDVAVITNIESVHLEFFRSISAIAEAKAEIFDGMAKGSFAIINFDNPYHLILQEKANRLNIISFAETAKADFNLITFNYKEGITDIKVSYSNKIIDYSIGLIGKQHVINSLAVLAAVYALQGEVSNAAYQLIHFTAQKRRGEIHKLKNNIIIIDDSYNASPAAVKVSLENLPNFRQNNSRLIAVLGDMKELGPQAITYHKELLPVLTAAKVDLVFTVGELMSHLFEILPANVQGIHAENSAIMAENILENIKPNDVIIIKGSLSMKMDVVVKKLLENF